MTLNDNFVRIPFEEVPNAFQPIVLTLAGDALTLPEQHVLYNECGNEVESYVDVNRDADLEVLKLGTYSIQVMLPESDEFIGSPCHEQTQHMLGLHQVCGGELRLGKISDTHRVISCPMCCLRVPIPRDVMTYAELRAYTKDVLLADPSGR